MIGPGQELGGYTIIKRIGHGGIGEVYFAQHRRVNRRAAIKVLLPELAQKSAVLEHFFKEARNTSLIKHRGIVEILDCDIVDGQPFVITEFLEGESLGGYLARAGTLGNDLAFLLGVMAAVAEAVEAAHVAGIMHRDLKPENIYLQLASPADPTVTVKVLDFGIAKLSREDGGPSQTKTGLWLTQPTYMSPEQCRGAGRMDPRSDIYSLGCVFYEALCGQPPFGSQGIADLIVAHVSLPPKPPIKSVPDLPPKLNSLILRMLAKKPDERPQTMGQVVATLRDCARALGIDFEGPLQPSVPVERPTALLGAALAAAPVPAKAPGRGLSGPVPVLESFAAAPPRRAVVEPQAQPQPQPLPPAPQPPPPAVPPVVTERVVTFEMPSLSPIHNKPAETGPAPSTAAPVARPARAVPRTLLAGADHRQIVAAAAAAAANPEQPIKGFAGGTMVLQPNPSAQDLPPSAKPVPEAPIRAAVGGTMIMDRFEGAPDDDEVDPADDSGDDDDDDRDPPGKASQRGDARHDRTIRVPSEKADWLGRAIPALRARWRLLVVLGGCVVLAAIVTALLVPGGGKSRSKGRAKLGEPVGEGVGESADNRTAKQAPRAEQMHELPEAIVPPPPPPAPAPIQTVQVDIQGLSAETVVTVDGQPATLPVRIPRGPELHRFSLRPPSGGERTIEIDGTRDRVIELVMAPERKKAPPPPVKHAPAHPVSPAGSPKPSAPSVPKPKAKPGAVGSDRKAIIDL